MRTTWAVAAAMSTLLLSSCKAGPASLADKKDLVCLATKAWMSADPAVKNHLADSLSSAIRQAEQSSTPESDPGGATKSVIGAARKLLDDETAAKATGAMRTIEKYC